MSKPKPKRHSKRRQAKRGELHRLVTLSKSSIQLIALILIPLAALFVVSRAYEGRASIDESTFSSPVSAGSSVSLNLAEQNSYDETANAFNVSRQIDGQGISTEKTTLLPHLSLDTEVLVYTGEEKEDWRPVPFGRVTNGQEFQFGGDLYYLDQNNEIKERNVDAAKLLEADRVFNRNNSRFPEDSDVVRFVDEDFNHIRHDSLETFKPGDYFLFQGQLYEGVTHPNNPNIYGYRSTRYILAPPDEIAVVDTIIDLTLSSDPDEQYFVSGAPQDPYFIPALNDYVAMSDLKAGMTYRTEDGTLVTVIDAQTRRGRFVVHQPTYRTPINQPPEELLASLAVTAESEDESGTPAYSPDLIEELVEAQADRAHPFDLGAQVTQAQAVNGPGSRVTDFDFTGQRLESFGLLDYNGRYYDPLIGRMISPDPIIPGVANPQALNHYSYVLNNPVRFNDPSGNFCWGQPGCAVAGSILVVAETVNPIPLDPVLTPMGLSMIASDPWVQQGVATYGPQIPAAVDQTSAAINNFLQFAQQTNSTSGNFGQFDPGNFNFDPGQFDPNKYTKQDIGKEAHRQFRQEFRDQMAKSGRNEESGDFFTEKAIRDAQGNVVRINGRFGRPDAVDYKNHIIYDLKPWQEGGVDQILLKYQDQFKLYRQLYTNAYGVEPIIKIVPYGGP